MSPSRFEADYPRVRDAIGAIITLLDTYEIAATWAVVGHLFLESCERDPLGMAHPDIVHPSQSGWTKDWFALDPCTDRRRDHLWYGADILDIIEAARVPQEIGSHSFSHPRFGDPAMTREAAASILTHALKLPGPVVSSCGASCSPATPRATTSCSRHGASTHSAGSGPKRHVFVLCRPPCSAQSDWRPRCSAPGRSWGGRGRSCQAFGTSLRRCC